VIAGKLAEILGRRPLLILDGAMGTELQRRGVDTGLPLWSANALIHRPEVVLEIHRDYIAAGADIITTNTFRTTQRTFRRAGTTDRSAELTALAVRLAEEAVAAFPGRELLIAGCIAPLEDCYRPDLVPPETELEPEHSELALRLAAAGADFLLVETMNTIREAAAACRAATATGLETIVSFLCRSDGQLYGGESLDKAVRTLLPLGPTGLSVNCISPHHLGQALSQLRSSTELPLAVYGNVGRPEGELGSEFARDMGPEEYARFGRSWIETGVSIVGGCCGTTPDYIRTLSNALHPS
jgi:S-methylmethionine-dependent homocysteine/selenocysteine methylase